MDENFRMIGVQLSNKADIGRPSKYDLQLSKGIQSIGADYTS